MLHRKWVLIFAFLFAACAPNQNKPVIQTLPPALSYTETSTRIVLPTETKVKPTSTPLPSPAPTSTPTPFPLNIVRPDTVVMAWCGKWSPARNEIVYYSWDKSGEEVKPVLIKMAAPDFQPEIIGPARYPTCEFRYKPIAWSLDGEQIYFGGPHSKDQSEFVLKNPDMSSKWVMDQNGSRAFFDSPVRWLQFYGWLDPNTLVAWGYAGGSNQFVYQLNVKNPSSSKIANFYGDTYSLGKDFIAAAYGDPEPAITVISRNGRIIKIPLPKVENGEWVFTSFADWLPDSNQALIAKRKSGERKSYQLLLWDIDKNNVIPLVPNGAGGRFSPDGKYLAYLTPEEPELGLDNRPVDYTGKQEMGHPYMQLLEMQTNTVFLSVPITKWIDPINSYSPIQPQVNFSSDGKYLALLSDQEIELDGGTPQRQITPAKSGTFLYIYDLTQRKIIWFKEGITDLPVWSPKNDKAAIQTSENDLFLLNLSTGKERLLTSGVGKYPAAQWSFDGSYLSYEIDTGYDAEYIEFLKTSE